MMPDFDVLHNKHSCSPNLLSAFILTYTFGSYFFETRYINKQRSSENAT